MGRVRVIEAEPIYCGSIRVKRDVPVAGYQAGLPVTGTNGFRGGCFAVVVVPRVCACRVSKSRGEKC